MKRLFAGVHLDNYRKLPFWTSWVVVGTIAYVVVLTQLPIVAPVDAAQWVVPLTVFSLLGSGFAYAAPHLKVGWLNEVWKVPRTTYLYSRPLLCLVGTSFLVTLAGSMILALLGDEMHLYSALACVPSAAAFLFSANRRMGRHPASEFSMSWGRRGLWKR